MVAQLSNRVTIYNIMNKLTDPIKIKNYIKYTIRHGKKDRIQKVLNHYWNKEDIQDNNIISAAKEIFNV